MANPLDGNGVACTECRGRGQVGQWRCMLCGGTGRAPLASQTAVEPVAWCWWMEHAGRWQIIFDKKMAEACQSLFDSKGDGRKVVVALGARIR